MKVKMKEGKEADTLPSSSKTESKHVQYERAPPLPPPPPSSNNQQHGVERRLSLPSSNYVNHISVPVERVNPSLSNNQNNGIPEVSEVS